MATAQVEILLPVHELMIKALLYRESELTEWESKFLSSIAGSKYLTGKQIQKLKEIYESFRHGKQFNLFVDETWEDVHEFDK